MSDIVSSSTRPRAQPRLSKKITRHERTRTEILDAALEFLWSHPFRDLTVNALMRNTSVSRSAFYQYFEDLHDLMQELLDELEQAILAGAAPWFTGAGDPVALLRESLTALVRVCYERGPLLRAVADAAPTDNRLETAWNEFVGNFDAAVAERIKEDQRLGLIPDLNATTVAKAFNRMDAFYFIHAFGQRPRNKPGPVLDAITTIWIATLYGDLAERKSREGAAPQRR